MQKAMVQSLPGLTSPDQNRREIRQRMHRPAEDARRGRLGKGSRGGVSMGGGTEYRGGAKERVSVKNMNQHMR